MPEKKNGHHETVAHEDGGCDETPEFCDAQGPCQEIHEEACEHEVQEHGIAISLFRGEEVKKESERVEDRGFEMGPEWHSSENVGIPVRDLMVNVHLVVQELFHAQIEGDEVVTDQKVPRKNDVPEQISAEEAYDTEG